jgi:hypothetical protein
MRFGRIRCRPSGRHAALPDIIGWQGQEVRIGWQRVIQRPVHVTPLVVNNPGSGRTNVAVRERGGGAARRRQAKDYGYP